MEKGLLEMSGEERDRAHLMRLIKDKKLKQRQVAERLKKSVRQVKRLYRLWLEKGDEGLVNKQRGKPSHNRMKSSARKKVQELLKTKYPDFGATLAAEKLLERDKIKVSVETVRKEQIALGLHIPKRRKDKKKHPPRTRRPRFGEMIQIDGSPHKWFEDRGRECCLIVFIDDATSKITSMQFAPSETTKAYLQALKKHVLQYGVPLTFYSDRHGIFRVNAKHPVSGDGKTDFGHVCERLKIESIGAHTPQAKGRVERSNQTLQDRFVKELRLEGISTIEEANAFIPEFMKRLNKKFARKPFGEEDAHRPWAGTEEELDLALAKHEDRKLSKNLTFRHKGAMHCVNGALTAMRGAKVKILSMVEGGIKVFYKGSEYNFTTYRRDLPLEAEAEDEKTINARVSDIVAKQVMEEAKGKYYVDFRW